MQLFDCIQTIEDPRRKRGVRHPCPAILKLLLLGFVCRLVAVEHMVAFFGPIWNEIKGTLGFDRPAPPNPTTIRRVLNGLKPEALQKAFEQWVAGLVGKESLAASVDGKVMKNVKGDNGLAVMLLNVFAQDLNLALAEYPIEAKEGEPTVLKEALGSLFNRYPGLKILVGDAAFAGRELNEAIISLGREYVAQVKDNQPKLKVLLEKWFQGNPLSKPPAAREVKKKRKL